MFDFGFDGSASLNIPQIDLDLNINNSLSGVMLNAESSCNTLNSTPSPQFSATALLQKAKLTESTSNTGNVSLGDSVVDSAEARHFLGGQGPASTALLHKANLTGSTSNNGSIGIGNSLLDRLASTSAEARPWVLITYVSGSSTSAETKIIS
ncbi:hypothetical protein ACET3Z_032158 [Daucus carota]